MGGDEIEAFRALHLMKEEIADRAVWPMNVRAGLYMIVTYLVPIAGAVITLLDFLMRVAP